MSTRWYYAKAGTTERTGPVSIEQIQQKLSTGELDGLDIVWRSGMPQWAPIGQMPEFALAPAGSIAPAAPQVAAPPRPPVPPRMPAAPQAPYAPQPPLASSVESTGESQAAVPVAAHSVGYFIPGGDMPARARENLAPYAKATGPVGDWPLNDDHVMQLAEAVKWRKRILSAAGLTRLFFLLSVIASVIFLASLAIAAASSRNASRDVIPMAIFAAILVPFTALYGFAGRAIKYCRSWGALVMAILTTLGIFINLGSLGMTVAASPRGLSGADGPVMVVSAIFVLLIGGAIAAVYWRAFSATSRYLNSPVWCQEALAVAEKAK